MNNNKLKKIKTLLKNDKIESIEKIKRLIKLNILKEPTYQFKVGDRVCWGRWDWLAILKVYENGKYYKIFKVTKNIEYGMKKGANFGIVIVPWFVLHPYPINTTSLLLKEKNIIKLSYSQRDIFSILSLYYGDAGIDLNPNYQRELVWEKEQKVMLIDSIFKNIDIGKFTIIRKNLDKELDYYYEVLDGKQRIQTIIDFYECRFNYKNVNYNQLNFYDQQHFKHYPISWAETNSISEKQKYEYFIKLNTTGIPMGIEHLKKIASLLKNK